MLFASDKNIVCIIMFLNLIFNLSRMLSFQHFNLTFVESEHLARAIGPVIQEAHQRAIHKQRRKRKRSLEVACF